MYCSSNFNQRLLPSIKQFVPVVIRRAYHVTFTLPTVSKLGKKVLLYVEVWIDMSGDVCPDKCWIAVLCRFWPHCSLQADSHIPCRAHAVPLPCRAAKGLDCVFLI